jgi:hypothetical protein
MRTLLRTALLAAAVAVAAPLLSSCYYDSYGYYPGYTTGSVLVSTSSSYWGYDPYRYCYYDYRRRCYYDPYLRGYYPAGYRPPAVRGCPHPHGWRPGRGVYPAPHNPRSHNLSRQLNRLHAMQQCNTSWARHVSLNTQSQHHHMRQNPTLWQNRVNHPNVARPAGRVSSGSHRPTLVTTGSRRHTGGTVTTSGSRHGSGSHVSGVRPGIRLGSPGMTHTGSGSHGGGNRGNAAVHSAGASRMAAAQAQARAASQARAAAAAQAAAQAQSHQSRSASSGPATAVRTGGRVTPSRGGGRRGR